MLVAIIPARGGSKRIPRKNIRKFADRPIIGWPIKAALDCGLFDRVIVTTDDKEIAEVAIKCGAEVPFLRPDNLSDDHTGLRPVLRHAITEIENTTSRKVSLACCLYAASPFVQASDLIEGHKFLQSSEVTYAFAGAPYPHPIQRAVFLDEQGGVQMAHPDLRTTRTQDLKEHFYEAGMFFWGRRDAFFTDIPIFSEGARIVRIPRERAHDIDEPEDWEMAELAFQILSRKARS